MFPCAKRTADPLLKFELTTIPPDELRNDFDEVLRRAEAGAITITGAGREVAELGPTRKRTWVSGADLAQVWQTSAPQTLSEDLERFPAGVVDPFE